jgi:hypothetical protein
MQGSRAWSFMLVKKAPDLTYKDVTPKSLYMGRRNFLFGLAAAYGAVVGYKKLTRLLEGPATGSKPVMLTGVTKWPGSTTEKETSLEDVTHYNNFYEFGTGKTDPAANARNFVTTPWSISVEGEVKNKRRFSMDEIMKLAPLEERIYRHRCVEGWSIVVPWIGYSLNTIVKLAEPTPKAKFVAFESYYDPKQMPEGGSAGIELGRSDESFDAAHRGNVWRVFAEPGWRAGAAGDSLEIWIQEHQIAGAHTLRERSAGDDLEYLERARIWFLLERESERGSSALVASDRAPPGRIPAAADADVQWLRRSGRQHVRRHGPEEILLSVDLA